MTLVALHNRLAVNPEYVTCVRRSVDGVLYVELVTGTRHEMTNINVDQVMEKLTVG